MLKYRSPLYFLKFSVRRRKEAHARLLASWGRAEGKYPTISNIFGSMHILGIHMVLVWVPTQPYHTSPGLPYGHRNCHSLASSAPLNRI